VRRGETDPILQSLADLRAQLAHGVSPAPEARWLRILRGTSGALARSSRR
jgi:hypothetical protein